MRNNKD